MIPDHSLDEIRSRLDMVEFVREYVPDLKRSGRHVKARCPFHQERTPSFVVNSERQSYHCFGCGEGGDAFSFLMKVEGLSFMDAAQRLAERTGVKLALSSSQSAESAGSLEREHVRSALEFALAHYRKALKGPEGQAARSYLAKRAVSEENAEAFELGFAPARGHLAESALKEGHSEEILIKAGLAARRTGGGLRDYFFDRVLYPIRDARGSLAGFGGRTLGEGEPKYLNSPESPVFSKGKVLYGLFQGLPEIRKERRLLLMEGYMDVMACHQHGLKRSCAPLGTALTPDQARLIKRHADVVTLVFDADRAGQAAAVRGAETLMVAGLQVRIATVPEGKDPDEHLSRFGVKSFSACLTAAVDLVDFMIESFQKRHPGGLTPQLKSEAAQLTLASITLCPDEILKEEWLRKLAVLLKVSEDAIHRQMGKSAPNRRVSAPALGAKSNPYGAKDKPAAAGMPLAVSLSVSEEHILSLLLKDRRLGALVLESDFASESGRRIFRALGALSETSSEASWSAKLLDALEAADRACVSRLLVDNRPISHPEENLKIFLARRRRETRIKELEPRIHSLAGVLNPDDAKLSEEYHKLISEQQGTKKT